MKTIARADWSNVSVSEYHAIEILKRGNVAQRLNAYWDETARENVPVGPVRLTGSGEKQLVAIVELARTTTDEAELIKCGGDLLRLAGVLAVVDLACDFTPGY